MDSLRAWLEVSVFGLTLFAMLVGLVGLAVPVFPGILVMWLAALGYGLVSGFSPLGIGLFIVLTLAMIAGEIVDNLLIGAGARQGGAAWRSIIVGALAGLGGTLLLPPLGGLVAAPLAVLLLEYRRGRDWQRAWRATRGLALGWGLSFLVRFGIGLGMIGLWLAWAIWG
jgi:uncharacterized protein YqgC (DUF456 family)